MRQQAADLISRIAVVMKTCQEEKLMGHLGVSRNNNFILQLRGFLEKVEDKIIL